MACRWPSTCPAGSPAPAATSRSCSTLARTSPRGRCSATKATTPRRTERRRAGAASAPPSRTARMPPQTGVLPQDTLQRTRPRRTGRRQDQALQTHRLALREDGTELRRLYLARLHLYLGEIRPHDLDVPPCSTSRS